MPDTIWPATAGTRQTHPRALLTHPGFDVT